MRDQSIIDGYRDNEAGTPFRLAILGGFATILAPLVLTQMATGPLALWAQIALTTPGLGLTATVLVRFVQRLREVEALGRQLTDSAPRQEPLHGDALDSIQASLAALAQDIADREKAQSSIERNVEKRIDRSTAELRREIKRLQRVEEDLRLSEEGYRAMTESADTGIALLDLDGRVIRSNPALHGLLGYGRVELQDLAFTNFLDRQDREARPGFEAVARGSSSAFREEVRLRRKDGSPLWVSLSASSVRDLRGEIQFGVARVEDVTERKSLERQLQKAQERALLHEKQKRGRAERTAEKLSAFPRFNPHPVVELDEAGALTFLNDAAQSLVRGLDLSDSRQLLPPEASQLVSGCLSEGVPAAGLEVHVSGRTITWLFYPVVPSRIVYGFGFDISDRLKLESQLQVSQKLEAVGRLAGGVAHDFNNVLTTVTGLSELLLQDLPDGPAREDVEEIFNAGKRAAGLTRQLLAFSRRQVLEPRILDLNAALRDLQKMLSLLVGEHIQMSAELAADLEPVRADPSQIEQVVMNLVVNARDAMGSGGHLVLSTRNVAASEGDEGWVVLSVRDDGEGMDAETQERIFEPFFTTKELGSGTGLGLATVYGIVQQSGGSIEVRSRPGQGTTIEVHLPASNGPIDSSDFKARASHGLSGSETVLLAEDEDGVRNLVTRALSRLGYRVMEATDGEEALTMARSSHEPIDLLITDVVMPRMNGRELAEHVARERPSTRVLFMSGYTDDVIQEQGVKAAGGWFLQKPLRPDALAAKVREVLDDEERV